MKTLLLQRQSPNGKAVRGTLSLLDDTDFLSPFKGGWGVLENLDFIIPDGTYTLTVTYSPRFKRELPLVCNVPYAGSGPLTPPPSRGSGGLRSGIRFHRGTLPEHSKGCILLDSDKSVSILTSFIKSNEKVLLIIQQEK